MRTACARRRPVRDIHGQHLPDLWVVAPHRLPLRPDVIVLKDGGECPIAIDIVGVGGWDRALLRKIEDDAVHPFDAFGKLGERSPFGYGGCDLRSHVGIHLLNGNGEHEIVRGDAFAVRRADLRELFVCFFGPQLGELVGYFLASFGVRHGFDASRRRGLAHFDGADYGPRRAVRNGNRAQHVAGVEDDAVLRLQVVDPGVDPNAARGAVQHAV